MIGRRSFPFLLGLAAVDGTATIVSLLVAYRLRFSGFPFEVAKGVPELESYVAAAPVVVILALIANRWARLYRPEELAGITTEAWAALKSSLVTGVLVAAASFFYRGFEYSRLTLLLFVGVNAVFLLGARILVRTVLRSRAVRRMLARRCLIVGVGRQAQGICDRLGSSTYSLYKPVAFLDLRAPSARAELRGLPVRSAGDDLGRILEEERIELVVSAVSYRQYGELQALLDRLTRETPDVVLVPDDFGLFVLRSRAFEFQGLPMIALLETPMSGPDRVLKRFLDLILSALLLVLLAPGMVLIALWIRLTSGAPVLYRQERMGLDGRVFPMLKFRTMHPDAEARTGPQWTAPADPRRTRTGAFLRRTSLDELPQLLNVLKGDMSLVGPRPERPVFISKFRQAVPNYMLRHRIKAGMTGWAQVHGWRGNTSLRKRLQYDLYYVRNWSLGLDVRILLMTVVRGLIHRNAY
ncbi:MAG: undecaprenyl-phosphate glucose phosphotransferase [Planctomycetes bacterium]|nr:undecaprenyl-phosphate glucose phosphotransferase [Planctomycetota bacterium]